MQRVVQQFRSFIALVLCVSMVVSAMPVSAFAANASAEDIIVEPAGTSGGKASAKDTKAAQSDAGEIEIIDSAPVSPVPKQEDSGQGQSAQPDEGAAESADPAQNQTELIEPEPGQPGEEGDIADPGLIEPEEIPEPEGSGETESHTEIEDGLPSDTSDEEALGDFIIHMEEAEPIADEAELMALAARNTGVDRLTHAVENLHTYKMEVNDHEETGVLARWYVSKYADTMSYNIDENGDTILPGANDYDPVVSVIEGEALAVADRLGVPNENDRILAVIGADGVYREIADSEQYKVSFSRTWSADPGTETVSTLSNHQIVAASTTTGATALPQKMYNLEALCRSVGIPYAETLVVSSDVNQVSGRNYSYYYSLFANKLKPGHMNYDGVIPIDGLSNTDDVVLQLTVELYCQYSNYLDFRATGLEEDGNGDTSTHNGKNSSGIPNKWKAGNSVTIVYGRKATDISVENKDYYVDTWQTGQLRTETFDTYVGSLQANAYLYPWRTGHDRLNLYRELARVNIAGQYIGEANGQTVETGTTADNEVDIDYENVVIDFGASDRDVLALTDGISFTTRSAASSNMGVYDMGFEYTLSDGTAHNIQERVFWNHTSRDDFYKGVYKLPGVDIANGIYLTSLKVKMKDDIDYGPVSNAVQSKFYNGAIVNPFIPNIGLVYTGAALPKEYPASGAPIGGRSDNSYTDTDGRTYNKLEVKATFSFTDIFGNSTSRTRTGSTARIAEQKADVDYFTHTTNRLFPASQNQGDNIEADVENVLGVSYETSEVAQNANLKLRPVYYYKLDPDFSYVADSAHVMINNSWAAMPERAAVTYFPAGTSAGRSGSSAYGLLIIDYSRVDEESLPAMAKNNQHGGRWYQHARHQFELRISPDAEVANHTPILEAWADVPANAGRLDRRPEMRADTANTGQSGQLTDGAPRPLKADGTVLDGLKDGNSNGFPEMLKASFHPTQIQVLLVVKTGLASSVESRAPYISSENGVESRDIGEIDSADGLFGQELVISGHPDEALKDWEVYIPIPKNGDVYSDVAGQKTEANEFSMDFAEIDTSGLVKKGTGLPYNYTVSYTTDPNPGADGYTSAKAVTSWQTYDAANAPTDLSAITMLRLELPEIEAGAVLPVRISYRLSERKSEVGDQINHVLNFYNYKSQGGTAVSQDGMDTSPAKSYTLRDMAVAGFVWEERDYNSMYDATDVLYKGAPLHLYELEANGSFGSEVDQAGAAGTLTDESGRYTLAVPHDGEWGIKIDLPEGYQLVVPNRASAGRSSVFDRVEGSYTADIMSDYINGQYVVQNVNGGINKKNVIEFRPEQSFVHVGDAASTASVAGIGSAGETVTFVAEDNPTIKIDSGGADAGSATLSAIGKQTGTADGKATMEDHYGSTLTNTYKIITYSNVLYHTDTTPDGSTTGPGWGTVRDNKPYYPSRNADGGDARTDVAVIKGTDGVNPPEGFQFKEWNTERDGTGTGYAPGDELAIGAVMKDTELYAIYERQSYTLTYDPNARGDGEVQNIPDSEPHRLGDSVPLAVTNPAHANQTAPIHPAVEGQSVVFVGWSETKHEKIFTRDDEEPELKTEIDPYPSSNVSVYAVWGYDTNGNNIADVSETKYSITYHADPIDPSGAGAATVTGTIPFDNTKYIEGDTASLQQPEDFTPLMKHSDVEGRRVIFLGWSETPGAEIYRQERTDEGMPDLPAMIEGDVTIGTQNRVFYALWAYDENNDGVPDVKEKKYPVIFQTNGADDTSMDGMTLYSLYGMVIREITGFPTNPSKTNHKFAGWENSKTGETLTTTDKTIKDTITLTAQWRPDESTQEAGDPASTRLEIAATNFAITAAQVRNLPGTIKMLTQASAWDADDPSSLVLDHNLTIDYSQVEAKNGDYPVKITATKAGHVRTVTVIASVRDKSSGLVGDSHASIAGNNITYPLKDNAGTASPELSREDIITYGKAVSYDGEGLRLDATANPIEVDAEQLAAVNDAITEGRKGEFPVKVTSNQGAETTLLVTLAGNGTLPDIDPNAPAGPNRKGSIAARDDIEYWAGGEPLTEANLKSLCSVQAKDANGNVLNQREVQVSQTELLDLNEKIRSGQKDTLSVTFTDPDGNTAVTQITLKDSVVTDAGGGSAPGSMTVSGNNFTYPLADSDGNRSSDITADQALAMSKGVSRDQFGNAQDDSVMPDDTQLRAINAAIAEGKKGVFPLSLRNADGVETEITVTLAGNGTLPAVDPNAPGGLNTRGALTAQEAVEYSATGAALSETAVKELCGALAEDMSGNKLQSDAITISQSELQALNDKLANKEKGEVSLTFTDQYGNTAKTVVYLRDLTDSVLRPTPGSISGNGFTYPLTDEGGAKNPALTADDIITRSFVTARDAYGNAIDRNDLEPDARQLQIIEEAIAGGKKGPYPITFTQQNGASVEITVTLAGTGVQEDLTNTRGSLTALDVIEHSGVDELTEESVKQLCIAQIKDAYGNALDLQTQGAITVDVDELEALNRMIRDGKKGKGQLTFTDQYGNMAITTIMMQDTGESIAQPQRSSITGNDFVYPLRDGEGKKNTALTAESIITQANIIARDAYGNAADVRRMVPDAQQLATITAAIRAERKGPYPITFSGPGGEAVTITVTLAGSGTKKDTANRNGSITAKDVLEYSLQGNALTEETVRSLFHVLAKDPYGNDLDPAVEHDAFTVDAAQLAAVNQMLQAGQKGDLPVTFTDQYGNRVETMIRLRDTDESVEQPKASSISGNDFAYPLTSENGSRSPVLTSGDIIAQGVIVARDEYGNALTASRLRPDTAKLRAINEAIRAGQKGSFPMTYTEPNGAAATITVTLAGAGVEVDPQQRKSSITAKDVVEYSLPDGELTMEGVKTLAGVLAKDKYGNTVDSGSLAIDESQLAALNEMIRNGQRGGLPITFTDREGNRVTTTISLMNSGASDAGGNTLHVNNTQWPIANGALSGAQLIAANGAILRDSFGNTLDVTKIAVDTAQLTAMNDMIAKGERGTVSITFTDPETTLQTRASVTLFGEPDVTIQKRLATTGRITKESVLDYEIRIANDSATEARNIVVKDVPAGLQLGVGQEVTGVTFDQSSLTWTIERIGPDEAITLKYQMTVADGATEIDNTAEVISVDGTQMTGLTATAGKRPVSTGTTKQPGTTTGTQGVRRPQSATGNNGSSGNRGSGISSGNNAGGSRSGNMSARNRSSAQSAKTGDVTNITRYLAMAAAALLAMASLILLMNRRRKKV